jgi:hypothetical protein
VQYFTVIDVHWGFNNVRIREGDEWKAMFITNWGLFEPLVMYFSMCNALATLQRMMDVLFQKVLMSGRVFVYVDDVLIAGDDLEELRHWTREVLMIMRESRLSCNPSSASSSNGPVTLLNQLLSELAVCCDD